MNIEERVVNMKFNNQEFEQGASKTLSTLGKLKDGLKMEGATRGLEEVSNAANRFSLDGMKNQLSGVLGHFTAMQVAAISALNNIVSRAVDAGYQIAKSLTIDPITQGFREYETNLNSIQTILANTGLEGAAGLKKVTDSLDDLNHYSDQTIYNFSEMAKNIGTFTAAGVSLDKSTAAIKGIANLAAVSGSNSQQASTAMYQLSQALSAGKVSLEDWNSVVNAGMGGKIFRESLIETARVHGVNIDAIIKKQGSFRNSIQEGWITTDILAETLSKFTGDLSEAQLQSLGYTKEQIDGIMKMGKTATDAATKVKTMTQLLDTLREGATSGWAKTWQIIFGDFDEARGMFTEVSNVLGGAINQMSDARNNLLQGWKDLGGRDVLIDGIAASFHALLSVMKPIVQAFRQIFPETTAKQLYDLTVSFRNFMESLKIGDKTANDLRRTFAGLFAIFGIGWDFIKAAANFLGDLIGKFSGGSDKVLRFTGNIGDFLVALRKTLQEGQFFEKVFNKLAIPVNFLYDVLVKLEHLVGKVFKKLNLAPAEKILSDMVQAIKPLLSVSGLLEGVWDRLVSFILRAGRIAQDVMTTIFHTVRNVVQGIQDGLGGAGEGISLNGILKGAGLAALIAFITTLKNFFKNFKPGEFLDSLTDSFEALTGALRGMQNVLNATALLGIAVSIGIMAISMEKLSKIDQAGLIRASSAIAVLMTELAGAFILFDKVGGTLGAAKLIITSTALIRLGAALLILVAAVEKLAKLSWEELAKGLTGVLVLTGALVAGVKFLPTDIGGVVKTATALVVLTIAIRNLVNAVEDLGQLSWQELAKGLTGVAGLLVSLALFTKFSDMNKGGGITSGIGIILIATAVKILASAVADFVKFNWEQIGRGLAGVAGGLTLIAAALILIPPTSVFSAVGVLIVAASLGLIADGVKKMSAMSWGEIGRGLTVMAGALTAIALAIGFLPPTSLLSAAAVLVVAASLGMIQEALGKMSKMTWEEIGRGLVVLAGSLLIIAGALFLMQNAIPGALAVLIIAGALLVLTPVLKTLGEMSWEAIVKGLAALAGVFLILGAAGVIIGPLAGVIAALAGSIFLIGVAVLAAGVGLLAFATALGILTTVGAGATAVLVGIVAGLAGLIPLVMEQIGLGIIAFARVIAMSGKAVTDAFTTILISLIDAIIKVTPKLTELILVLLDALFKILVDYFPKMVDAGAKIIIGVLTGMKAHVDEAADKATDLVVAFLGAIGRNFPRLVQAGIDLIVNYINGLAKGIRDNGARVGEAGVNLGLAIVEGTIRGIGAGLGRAVQAAANLAKEMFNAAKRELGINSPSREFMKLGSGIVEGVVLAISNDTHLAASAAAAMGENAIEAMRRTLSGIGAVLGSDLIDFNPVISPVLDLSSVETEASKLAALMSVGTFDVSGTAQLAQETAAAYEDNRTSTDIPDDKKSGGNTFIYNQTNNSPKALSEEEIYRKTNNLISRKKREESNA